MEYDQMIEGTLAFINEVRAFFGDEPLTEIEKGYRLSSRNCPISTSIGHGVGTTPENDGWNVKLYDEDNPYKITRFKLNPSAEEFVTKFDSCELTEYLIRPC